MSYRVVRARRPDIDDPAFRYLPSIAEGPRIDMAVDRIIFLLAIIRLAKNAPHSVESVRDGFRWKYQFVLNPDVNDFNVSTDSVGSMESAPTPRIASDDFSEFGKKSASSDVKKSLEPMTIIRVAKNAPYSVGSTRDRFRWKYQLGLNSDVNDFKASSNSEFGKKSASSDVTKSSESIASSITRISRSSGTIGEPAAKRRKSKQKSPGESAAKFGKGEARGASREKKKSSKGDEARRNAGQKKKNSIPLGASSTEEPWNMLMIMAAKSLIKSDEASTRTNLAKDTKTSVDTGKSLASAKPVDGRKTISSKKKNSSKHKNRPATKNPRKSSKQRQKPKSSAATQKRKSTSKPLKRIASKNRQKNRDRRETEFPGEPETKCVSKNDRRSVRNSAKQDFIFNIPMACTVIKISSSSCGTDCAEESSQPQPQEPQSQPEEPQSQPEEPQQQQLPSQPKIGEDTEGEKSSIERPAELLPNENEYFDKMPDEEPIIYDSGMGDDPSESYDEYRDSELPDETHDVLSPPEESPYVSPPEYQDPSNPPSDVNSPSTIFQPDARPKDPTRGQLRQYDGYGSQWWNPFHSRPPFASSSATSRPIETLERPVTPKNPFLTPTGSVNGWTRPPEAPGGVFNVSAGADDEDDEEYDYDDDEEDYEVNFDGDEEENELDAKVEAPVENLAQTKPEHESREVSKLNSQMNDDDEASKEDDDYGDEDYDYSDEDYDKDDYNEEDYSEEAGNTGISDEDDYDSDED